MFLKPEKPSIRTTRARSARRFEALEFDFVFDSDWIRRDQARRRLLRFVGSSPPIVRLVVTVVALACLGRSTLLTRARASRLIDKD